MVVTVLLPRALERFAGDQRRVEVKLPDAGDQSTAGAGLEALFGEQPSLRDRIFDDQGGLRRHVNVFVDGESVRFSGGLSTAVKDGGEIAIVPAVSGG